MVNYKNGKIYKLVNSICNEGNCYYGSTCNKLRIRKQQHKYNYKYWKEGKYHFVSSFKLFDEDFENTKIILVEEVKCDNKQQLLARERFYIENYKCLNKCVPGRTKKEYIKTNAIKIKEQRKEYREKNADKIKEYAKEQRKKNADKHKEYRKEYNKKNADKHKQYMKEYRKKNADEIKQKTKEYNEINADKLKEKVKCPSCGCFVRKYGLKRHQRSIKCKSFQNNIKY